jgi:hypothetical protein
VGRVDAFFAIVHPNSPFVHGCFNTTGGGVDYINTLKGFLCNTVVEGMALNLIFFVLNLPRAPSFPVGCKMLIPHKAKNPS